MANGDNKTRLGFMSSLFDLNRDGQLDITEECIMLSVLEDMLKEEYMKELSSDSHTKTDNLVEIDDYFKAGDCNV